MPKKHYSLWVYYPAQLRSSELEDQITEAVGVESSGSGSDFKERDMDFSINTEQEAKRAIVVLANILPDSSSVTLLHFPNLNHHGSVDIIEKEDVRLAAATIVSKDMALTTPKAKAPHKRTGL